VEIDQLYEFDILSFVQKKVLKGKNKYFSFPLPKKLCLGFFILFFKVLGVLRGLHIMTMLGYTHS